MKALTIMEPWAWCIINLSQQTDKWKCVENRGERFPRYTGPLLIHSGQGERYKSEAEEIFAGVFSETGCDLPEYDALLGRGIVGGVHVVGSSSVERLEIRCDLYGIDYEHAMLWASGPICLLLARPFVFPKPIPARGKQGIWNVSDDDLFEEMDNNTWRKFKEWRGDR